MDDYGIKELYSVAIKATFPMEIGDKIYETNETILSFDNIQFASQSQVYSSKTAHGGKGDLNLINWDNLKETNFVCERGIISRTGLSILSNSKLITKHQSEIISVPVIHEYQEPNNGVINLKYLPNGIGFLYNAQTGEKLQSNLNSKTYNYNFPVFVDYEYNYDNGGSIIEIGNNLINGYLKLEGKFRLKDDIDGHEKTGIIRIPRIRIASNLVIRMGEKVGPMVNHFMFTGYPGYGRNEKVSDIIILNDDIDSDIL